MYKGKIMLTIKSISRLIFVAIVALLMTTYMELRGFVIFEIVTLNFTILALVCITINHYKKANEITIKNEGKTD